MYWRIQYMSNIKSLTHLRPVLKTTQFWNSASGQFFLLSQFWEEIPEDRERVAPRSQHSSHILYWWLHKGGWLLLNFQPKSGQYPRQTGLFQETLQNIWRSKKGPSPKHTKTTTHLGSQRVGFWSQALTHYTLTESSASSRRPIWQAPCPTLT